MRASLNGSREDSKETMSDSAITQDILDNESEKPVWTTSEDIKSETADLYYITRTYSLPAYLAD